MVLSFMCELCSAQIRSDGRALVSITQTVVLVSIIQTEWPSGLGRLSCPGSIPRTRTPVAQIVLLYIARLFRDLSFFRKMTLFHGLEAGDPNTPPFFRSCEISVKRNMGIRFSPEHSSHMNDKIMQ